MIEKQVEPAVPVEKIHVLIISDDCAGCTGFGRVVSNLGKELIKQYGDRVELRALAMFPLGRDEPRTVPTVVTQGQKKDDVYGVHTFHLYAEKFGMPDIIFLLGDWWYWKDTFMNPDARKQAGILSSIWYYAPLDGAPINDNAVAVYRGADKTFAMSPFGQEVLKKAYGVKATLLPHGVDPEIYSYREKHLDGAPVWGVVSRNGPRKHLHKILEAHNMLAEKDKGVLRLHVPVGDEVGGDLRGFVKTRGFTGVEFTDSAELTSNDSANCQTIRGAGDEDMAEFYHGIDCLLSACREGFGLPVLEARACGARVVLPKYSGHFSMGYDGAICYPVTSWGYNQHCNVLDPDVSVEVLADAMRVAAAQMRKGPIAALPNADRLTWENIAQVLGDAILHHGKNARIQMAREAVSYYLPEHKVAKEILLVMPASTGDVLLTTSTAHSLKAKFPGHRLVFATGKKFMGLLDGCPWIDSVVEYLAEIHDNYPLMHRHYEAVFTPHFETQKLANWVHGGHGEPLAEVYARHCGVALGEYWAPVENVSISPSRYITLHVGSGKGEQQARWYEYWGDVVDELKGDIHIVQIGQPDDKRIDGTTDMRGRFSFRQMYGAISGAVLHLGIDSFPMHASAVLGKQSVILWGNTFPQATGPDNMIKHFMHPIITPDYYECQRPCHHVVCDKPLSCVNRINPMNVARTVRRYISEQ